jgi:hypothetical protein
MPRLPLPRRLAHSGRVAGKTPSGWKSEHVAAAIVAAVAAVLVAGIGLLGSGSDSEKTEPKISIGDFRFFPVSSGDIRIQVTGTVADFRAGDRLYAIAEPSPVEKKIWWVSQQVAPTLDGTWIAQILAQAAPGQQLRIYAVRVPAGPDPTSDSQPASQSNSPDPTTSATGPPDPTTSATGPPDPTTSATEPTETETGGATETAEPSSTPSSTSSSPDYVEPVDRTRAVLQARGPGAVAADVISRAVTIPTPP